MFCSSPLAHPPAITFSWDVYVHSLYYEGITLRASQMTIINTTQVITNQRFNLINIFYLGRQGVVIYTLEKLKFAFEILHLAVEYITLSLLNLHESILQALHGSSKGLVLLYLLVQ